MKKILGIGVVLVYTAFLPAALNQEPLTAPQLKSIIEGDLLGSEDDVLTFEFLMMLYEDEVDRALFEAMLDLHGNNIFSEEQLADIREDIEEFAEENPELIERFLQRLTSAFNASPHQFTNIIIGRAVAYQNDAMEVD